MRHMDWNDFISAYLHGSRRLSLKDRLRTRTVFRKVDRTSRSSICQGERKEEKMITTSNNAKVRKILQLQKKSKLRKEERVFIVEGPKMYEELPVERIESVFVSESFYRAPEHKALLRKYEYEVVKDAVFADMSDTKTPQGILAVAAQYRYEMDDLLPKNRPPFLLVLDRIQDPGNLGTMLRTGEAAGITGVLMSQDTVDLYNPKVIRSTMGSLYRIPFVIAEDLPAALQQLKTKGIAFYAAHLKGTQNYDKCDYRGPCGFLIGNESNGLSDPVAELADARIRIPMAGKVESLNAAAAATVLMFEAARQRRA